MDTWLRVPRKMVLMERLMAAKRVILMLNDMILFLDGPIEVLFLESEINAGSNEGFPLLEGGLCLAAHACIAI